MTKRKHFGTDGLRSRVGIEPMMPETVLKLGWAVGHVLANRGSVLLGKDTRVSGYMFESALESGLVASGTDVVLLGPIPTPAVSFLIRCEPQVKGGIVISASHNPYQDNGIKLFTERGFKLSDKEEHEVERWMDKPLSIDSQPLGKAQRMNDAVDRYAEFCLGTIDKGWSLSGVSVVVDCANGASYQVLPKILSALEAKLYTTAAQPDGININDGVGALHPEYLQQEVLARNADFGIAVDGDGDRLVMIDEHGETVDGDEMLLLMARHWKKNGQLKGGVVGTQMTNLGLQQSLANENIPFRRVPVGDRYILHELESCGWRLGGETSGHIICFNKLPAADANIAVLQVLQVLFEQNLRLSDVKKIMNKYPQQMINVDLSGHFKHDDKNLLSLVKEAEQRLGHNGRVLVRPSGTEPIVRVMVEADNENDCDLWCAKIAEAVRSAIEI